MPQNGRCTRLFVIGGSAGAIEAVRELLNLLPRGFPCPILVVIHTPVDAPGSLSAVLQRDSKLIVQSATDGTAIRGGHVYIAPPNYHMTVRDSRVRLLTGPVENRHRPSIDPLFHSAAQQFGPAAVGVVLSGYLDDGSNGLWNIKKAGGVAIAQSPEDAIVPDMPRTAADRVEPQHVVSIKHLAPLMIELAADPIAPLRATETASMAPGNEKIGTPSVFTCPECHGSLWEVDEGGTLRFRCRVGHSFTADTMLEDQSLDVERALWAALRVLEENSELSMRLASKAKQMGRVRAHKRYSERVEESRRNAAVLRELLTKGVRQEPKPARTLGEADEQATA